MLAARAEGIGACLTSVLGAFHLAETLEVLGVPTDADWTLFGCVSFGYPLGRWGVAERQPVDEVTSRNRWGAAAGLGASGPLWPPPAPG